MARFAPLALRCLPRNGERHTAIFPYALLNRTPYSQNAGDLQPKVTPSTASGGERLYKHEAKPTDFDKRILVWAGRYKKAEDIPEYISWETISSARSKVRVKICMAMIAATVIGCIFMVRSGKQALKEDRTLLQMNVEKKTKWKEQAEREKGETLKSH